MHPERLSNQFDPAKNQLRILSEYAGQYTVDISILCLGFVNSNKNIDKIVIGVDSLKDLQNNVHNYLMLNINYEELKTMSLTDENIILPFNWKK
jgi:hypothetical protein